MSRVSRTEFDRLRDVLLYDKINTPARLNDVVKSDILDVLSNYIDIIPSTFSVDLNVSEEGYAISITGKGRRLKSVGNI